MLNDLRNPVRGDDQQINIRHEHELTYWSYELDCSPEELRKAINKVGPSVKEIRKILSKQER